MDSRELAVTIIVISVVIFECVLSIYWIRFGRKSAESRRRTLEDIKSLFYDRCDTDGRP